MITDADSLLHDSAAKNGSCENLLKKTQEELAPFFENKQNLRTKVLALHLITAYSLIVMYRKQADHVFFNGLKRTLALYRTAYSMAPEDVINFCISNHSDSLQKESFMHVAKQSFILSDSDLSGDIYLDAEKLMTQIEKNVELGMQHILREILFLFRITKSKKPDPENIRKIKLGVATNELGTDNMFKSLLWTLPAEISISDWRNIAAHNTYSIKRNSIECSCRDGKKQFTITIEELLIYISQIVRASNAINIARCIFGYDHIDELSEKISTMDSVDSVSEFSISLWMSNIRSEFLKEGFDLTIETKHATDIGIEDSEDVFFLMVYELLFEANGMSRADQLAKHMYQLWRVFRKTTVLIYHNISKVAKYYIRVENSDCEFYSGQTTKHSLPILIKPIKFI